MNFRQIAQYLGKDPSTISKEVQKHRTIKRRGGMSVQTDCKYASTCQKQNMCMKANCDFICVTCRRHRCDTRCSAYVPTACAKQEHAPYVCNGCERRQFCKLSKYYYRAKYADDTYRAMLSEKRMGISLSAEALDELDGLVTPLLKKGQSIAHIFASHADEIPCSQRTLYNYIDQGLLGAKNIDLPRKIRYKPRRKKHKAPEKEPDYRKNRTYLDFQKYLEQNPETNVVEMDTVQGPKYGTAAILTMLFRNCNLMIAFHIPAIRQEHVLAVFEWLEEELGVAVFQKTFPVILTDNGSEFCIPKALECNDEGELRTRVFYCDPNASWQKGRLEKNHEFIRYVVPQGKPFDGLEQEDITLLVNHINSLARESLNGRTPFELAAFLLNHRVMRKLHLKRIPHDKVLLKPSLLNR